MASPLTRLVEALTPGTVLTCVENTLSPARTGASQVVLEAPRDGEVPCISAAGHPVTLRLPNRRGLVWDDDRTVRWPLGKTGHLAAHTVTYRIGAGH